MTFDPTLAAIRFGNGLSPDVAEPASVAQMLDLLAGPDVMAQTVPIARYDTATPSRLDLRDATRAVQRAETDAARMAAEDARQAVRAAARATSIRATTAQLTRDVITPDGFRERLVRFWADHFTAPPTSGQWRHLAYPAVEQYIRPFVAGQFADLLKSAITNPLLLLYFNQVQSVGPNSVRGLRRGGGLNENLAREVLELHTLGADGRYSQDDVRQFAELLTGLHFSLRRGTHFVPNYAEPGAETILGRTYGGSRESLDWIFAALDDLARHPDTARHVARKLITHFIGGPVDRDLLDTMSARYLETQGDLMAVYSVMLSHEAAWTPQLSKVKQPYDFIAGSLRALAVPAAELAGWDRGDVIRRVTRPLARMGQPAHTPVGPDGWSEDDAAWITPQGMAARITWAMQVPVRLIDRLPDPRDFVGHALGPTPPEAVVFAAHAAETVTDGIGLVLASAAFQRR